MLQAQESIGQSRPEAAQARGRALLNLRVQDAEGGLLGRTLLTLVSNKVGTLWLRACCPTLLVEKSCAAPDGLRRLHESVF